MVLELVLQESRTPEVEINESKMDLQRTSAPAVPQSHTLAVEKNEY